MERAVKLMLAKPAAGLLLDPGLGKTSITLAAFSILQEQGIVDRMLVIAPLRVCFDVWPGEIKKWKDFNGLKIEILHGSKKEELLKSDADVFVINPEGLRWLTKYKPGSKVRRKWNWPKMLVVDESTKFKHTNTARAWAIKRILGNFDRRYILTGTPAPNGLHDLFGQIFLLDFGEALGGARGTITYFRRRYFVPAWSGYGFDIRDEEAEEEIYEALTGMVLRLAAEDYLKLPPLISKTIGVDLPPDARKLYEELKAELVLTLDAGDVTAANAGVLTSKLRQVANGSVYLDDDDDVLSDSGADRKSVRKVGVIHEAKIDALEALIEELQGQPLMVAYEFRHDLAALRKAFGDDIPVLGAGTTPKAGTKITKAWNEGKLQLLFAHPASAGHGLNLQEGGHHICWYAQTWNLEHYQQLIARQWRQGQKFPVFNYHLVSKHTVDALIVQAREDKGATQAKLLQALKEMQE